MLKGCGNLPSDVVALRLELSLVPLYEGAWQWVDAMEWLANEGFEAVGIVPGFTDPESGRLLQFDGVFVRDRAAASSSAARE